MPAKRAPWLSFTKYRRTRHTRESPRSLSQALALLARKLRQDNILEAKNKACQTDFTEPDECNNEEEKTKDPTTSDPLHYWSDIYVKEELDLKEEPDDFDEVPSSTTALDTKCNSPIYVKIIKSYNKRQKATQTNEQDVTKKDEVVRIETDKHAMTYNTRTIESGKRIPKPSRRLLMESWESLKTKSKNRKKIKAKQTETQKLTQERLKQIMIESKTPSETTMQKHCGCGLCNGCSFTTFMNSAINRQLKLTMFIKSVTPQKQVAETNAQANSRQVSETNAPISNEQVSETNVSANNEQVAEINTGVNSGQQYVVRNTHSTVLEVVSADLDNAVIEASLHEKSGETNENNKQLATETNAPINNEQVSETNVLANNEQFLKQMRV